MRDEHLAEPILRAHLDGELPWADAMRCTLHLRRCALCRTRLEDARRLDEHAAALLARVAPVPGATGRAAGGVPAAWAGVALAVGLLLGVLLPRLGGPAERRATAEGVKDVCCWNLDGGPRGDDGVLTVSTRGETVDCVVLYDDADRTRHFSAGDLVRFATPSASCPARVAGALGRPVPPAFAAGRAVASR